MPMYSVAPLTADDHVQRCSIDCCLTLCCLFSRLQDKAADTIESLQKAGMKVWVLTGDKMETAAATCYASKLFRRSTQILELTTKRTEEQSLHDVLFDLSKTVLRQHGSMTRDTFSGWVPGSQHTHTCTWMCLTILVGTRSPHKNSKHTDILPTGDIFLV